MSPQEVDSGFIKQLNIVLEHWQMEANDQDKKVLDKLDHGRQNLFHIVNLGLEHRYTQTAASQLALAVFPLIEKRGYWSEWIPVLEWAIELRGRAVSALLFHLHNRLGQLYRWERQIGKAIDAHKTAENMAIKLADDHALANARFNLSEDFNQNRQFEASEKYGLMALQAFKELDLDEKWFAAVYNTLGTNAMNQGRLNTAEEWLKEAVAYCRQLDDSVRLARALYNLANVLRTAERFEEALVYFEEASGILDNGNQTHDWVSIQIALGGLFYDQGRLQAAESAFRKALSPQSIQLEYIYYQAYALQGLGNVLLKMERFSEAEPLLENAITYWQNANNDLLLANSLGTLAETLAAQNNIDRAISYYTQAIKLVEKHPKDPFGQKLLIELTDQLQEIMDSPQESGDF